jgi:hypothetical protein
LDGIVVETTFKYSPGFKARADYEMLIDMVKDGPTLLQEEIEVYCDLKEFAKNRII